jgi:hypothetical protein
VGCHTEGSQQGNDGPGGATRRDEDGGIDTTALSTQTHRRHNHTVDISRHRVSSQTTWATPKRNATDLTRQL